MAAQSAQHSASAVPTARDFVKLSRRHTLVPVYRTLTADLETPVSAFLRVAQQEPEAFLLESVEGGEHVGRYTFIGIEPYKKIVSRGTAIMVEEGGKRRSFEGDIFAELKRALGGHTPARLAGLPPFTAGAVGFFSYDVVRQIERLPSLAKDELGVPDACLMFFDQVLAFDHVKKEILLIVTADLTRDAALGKSGAPSMRSHRMGGSAHSAEAYAHAVKRLDRLEKRLARALPKPSKKHAHGKLKLNVTDAEGDFPEVGAEDEGVHLVRRCVSVRAVAALRLRSGSGCVRCVPRATDCESFAVHVFFAVSRNREQETGSRDEE